MIVFDRKISYVVGYKNIKHFKNDSMTELFTFTFYLFYTLEFKYKVQRSVYLMMATPEISYQ